jgi:hypothetical protein
MPCLLESESIVAPEAEAKTSIPETLQGESGLPPLTRNMVAFLSDTTRGVPETTEVESLRKRMRNRFCLCEDRNREEPMIECETCQVWYHESCVGVNCSRAPARWLCDDCCEQLNELDIEEDVETTAASATGVSGHAPEPIQAAHWSSPLTPQDVIECYVTPTLLFFNTDYCTALAYAFPPACCDFLVTDPPSGVCTSVYEWDRKISPWAFWTGVKVYAFCMRPQNFRSYLRS